MKSKLLIPVIIAAALWFYMFSPWTAGLTNFWLTMSFAAVCLTTLAFSFTPKGERLGLFGFSSRPKFREVLVQLLLGIVLAAVLWGVFWVGDKLSQLMFGFARPQVDNVYAMKNGFPAWIIGLLLLLVIGPAEELFWRGFVQRNVEKYFTKWPKDHAFLLTLIVYTLIHIWSFNFMLVMAALVAGCIWGFLYRLRPQLLPALIISHALWDCMVFVVFPI